MSVPNEYRIPKLPRADWTHEAREVFAFWGEPNAYEEGSKTNIMMVMGNHPPLGMVYNQFGKHFLMGNTLNTRQLEIIVLRIAWRVKSIYEWHNHVGYGVNAGLSLEDIAAIRDFPQGGNWSEEDAAIITACDELIGDNNISDTTWTTLSKTLNPQQLMDLVFTIGHYVMTSWALSAFGVPVEGGADAIGFDLKTQSGRTPGATLKPGEKEGWEETRGY
ncbi:MAG: carboxymuconolactone decarboxylase family protein [Alphaproteobacteria bacterium]|nr:carboxymuconolactone decarboxylase family protein [Alphaproteobacteria bacterium]MDE2041685.1 carboxymuconolactone decarboxylase family protein [Alphaproteobacteria bacterium]MDE2339704.1 carboxymuconolactone decarboxylase family protein [Alphaproteobacteria bacterium]